MPVVNLPQDTRWGDFGKSLGSLAGNVVAGYHQRVIDEGVAAIQADESIPQPDKLRTVMEKFGQQGIESFSNQLKATLTAAQIGKTGADTRLLGSEAKKTELANQVTENTLPAQLAKPGLQNQLLGAQVGETSAKTGEIKANIPLIAAKVPQTEAATALTKANIPLIAAKVPQTEAATALTKAETGKTTAQTAEAETANQIARSQLRIMSAYLENKEPLEEALASQGIKEPTEVARVRQALAMGGVKGLQSETDKILSEKATAKTQAEGARIRANAPKDLPSPERQFSANSSAQAVSTKSFLDALKKDPESGLVSGAPIKAWLEKHGVSTGDENLLRMYENSLQQISQKATSGSGFVSGERIKMARDVSQSLGKSPLANLIAIDTVADQQIAELHSRMRGLTDNTQKAPLEDALASWRELKADTGSLSSYVTKGGNTVIMYGGNEIKPSNLSVMTDGAKDYKIGGGQAVKGSALLRNAQAAGWTPKQVLEALRASHGYKGD